MKSLTAITIISVAVMIMASAGYYFYNNSINESSYPSYHVDMHLNATNLTSYYPIHVNSNLTGNGTYQQLLTISDPSHYGINANGSNLAFYDGSNNTHLYAWIQSINSTSMQIWVKNYNASNIIDMQVLPSYKDLFNATGYLGEAPQLSTTYGKYDNGKYVFNFYTDWKNNTFTGTGTISTGGDSNQTIFGNGVTIWSIQSLPTVGIETSANYNLSNSVIMAYMNTSFRTPQNAFYIGEALSGYQVFVSQNNGGAYQPQVSDLVTFNSTNDWINAYGQQSYNASKPFLVSLWQHGDTYYTTFQNASFNETSIQSRYLIAANVPLYFNTPVYMSLYASVTGENQSQHYYWFADRTLLPDGMPTFTIGSFTNMTDHAVASYLSNSITIPMPNWFNLTLKAYTNYSFTFHYNNTPLYFTYDGLINNTIYTGFLDSNLTLDIHFIALGYSGKTELIVGR